VNDKPNPLFDQYCKDTAAGDWHRPFENYCAGYQAAKAETAVRDPELERALFHLWFSASKYMQVTFPSKDTTLVAWDAWQASNANHPKPTPWPGCMRCNTPKKCAVHGCCPGTWPSETPATDIERKDALLRKAAILCDWIAETPHKRGSINGQAMQVGYAIKTELGLT